MATRAALIVGGFVSIIAGVTLLSHGGAQNQARLARVAGILVVLGVVALVAATVGTL
ncbi:MAG: hypothetical protein NVSMB22_17620 [Chloroflexota bacterium]